MCIRDSYTCVDNLPVRFLTELVANARDDGLERVAVAIDVRSPGELAELPDVVTALRAMGTSCLLYTSWRECCGISITSSIPRSCSQ